MLKVGQCISKETNSFLYVAMCFVFRVIKRCSLRNNLFHEWGVVLGVIKCLFSKSKINDLSGFALDE